MLRISYTAAALLIFAATSSVTAMANELTFRRIGTDDGLSNGTVYSVVQDRQGLMWIGTNDGLNRHDGIGTRVFRADPADPESLSDSWIRQILVDRDGHIWVGTWTGGLNRFDPATNGFIKYQFDSDDSHSLSDNSVRALYQDRQGDLWVGTQSGGLNRLDFETGRFERFAHLPSDPSSLSDDHIEVIYETRDGALWIGTKSGGLNRFDRNSGTFRRYQADPSRPNSLASNDVRGIYEDPAGVLWISTWGGGLQRFYRSTGEFDSYALPTTDPKEPIAINVRQVVEDARGDLWVATGNGLARIDRSTGKVSTYRHEPSDSYSLSHNHVRAIYQDRQGGLWLATLGGGVNRVDPVTESFVSRTIEVGGASGVAAGSVLAVSETADGAVWAGTNGSGLTRFRNNESPPEYFLADPGEIGSLSHNNVWALHTDSSGALWVGTEAGGLDVLRENEGSFVNFRHDPADPDSLSNNHVLAILEDTSGYLWIGTDGGGLNYMDVRNGTFEHFRHDPLDSSSLSHDHVISLYKDRYGLLWVGTWGGGLNVLSRDRSRFTRFREDPLDPQSLSGDTVWSIVEDANGGLWVATANGGLHRFDRERASFQRIDPEEGGRIPLLMCLQPDDDGSLWIATVNGLVRLELGTMEYSRFTRNDGLISNELTMGCMRSAQGEMVFGGWSGITRFLPNEVEINRYEPPVTITDLRINHQSVPLRSNNSQDAPEIDLESDDSIVTIEFAALDYRDPIRNRFRYRLVGFSDDWREVDGTNRSVTYTNLDPGDYTFRLQASNNHGIWNEAGASLHLNQLPAMWQTWWFRTIAFLALVALLSLAYKARTRQINEDRKRLFQIVEGSADALLLSSPNGEIAYANEHAAELFNYPVESFVGAHLRALIAPSDIGKYEEIIESSFTDGDCVAAELDGVTSDGEKRPIEIAVGMVQVGNEKAMSVSLRDLTELRQVEKELAGALAESGRLREQLAAENRMLREEIAGVQNFDEIIGKSDALQEALLRVDKVAGTSASVLIVGETGTGKELIARALHKRSRRDQEPFVTVNCAAIQGNLLESELFGYEKGAFTGATSRRAGRFEIADGGTLFLDEIGELPVDLQAKLLRVLESGEFSRLGSNESLKTDVRILAATNRDLPEAMDRGRFRSDLYFRIGAFTIELPPLRDRRDDIPMLVWHFVRLFNARIGRSIEEIPEGLMERLVSHVWEGNVRELRNVIMNGVVMSHGSVLRIPDFTPLEDNVVEQPAAPAALGSLEENQRNHILKVLEACNWKINGKGNAAERLNMNPSTLRFRMKKLGIKRP